MADTFTSYAPFAYDVDYYLYTERETAEKSAFISLMTQRNAKYKDAAKEVYNNGNLSDGEMFRKAFMGTIEVPTPQVMGIDGYDPAESPTESTTDEGGENGGNGNNAEPTNPETPVEP